MFDGYTGGCRLCPRSCGVDRRAGARGRCGAGSLPRVARAALHYWEEPCISGSRGSGTVFFSGCQLGCCFCQNRVLSRDNFGRDIGAERLSRIFLELQEQNAANINLVSGTQYIPQITEALDMLGGRLRIPVVWNTGGYETESSIEALSSYVDIWLTDIKFRDSGLSAALADAPDYFAFASAAALLMCRLAGKPVMDGDGYLQRGVIVRHLVLPGHRGDSGSILDWLGENMPADSFLLSLMSQYTPDPDSPYRELRRRVATGEYRPLAERAADMGFRGYTQERTSAKSEYTPDFDLTGVE